MLVKIDLWLLYRLEKFAHWWQKLTGKNCFWLAKKFSLLGGLSSCYFIAVSYFTFRTDPFLAGVLSLVGFILCLEVLHVLSLIKIIETIVLDPPNPFKYIKQIDRIFTIVSYPICAVMWAFMIYSAYLFSLPTAIFCASAFIWIVIARYLKCCDPLPPAKSRVKEWKEKFVNAVKGIFAPVPQPNPAHCE